MASNLQYSEAVRNAQLDAITAAIGTGGLLRIYSGAVPANVAASLGTAVQLAELPCSSPFASAASGGVLTVSTLTDDPIADATGTPSFFRVYQSDGTTAVVQGSVGASGCDINLTGLSGGQVTASGSVSVSSLTLTALNS